MRKSSILGCLIMVAWAKYVAMHIVNSTDFSFYFYFKESFLQVMQELTVQVYVVYNTKKKGSVKDGDLGLN